VSRQLLLEEAEVAWTCGMNRRRMVENESR